MGILFQFWILLNVFYDRRLNNITVVYCLKLYIAHSHDHEPKVNIWILTDFLFLQYAIINRDLLSNLNILPISMECEYLLLIPSIDWYYFVCKPNLTLVALFFFPPWHWIIPKLMSYFLDNFTTIVFFSHFFCCCRHVVLPKELVRLVPKSHLMSETEWRSIGVQQSRGWVHYMIHTPEPHILLFRRPLSKTA